MNSHAKPLITVLMPTYKRPFLLRRAIQCVLNQTYSHFKLYIYDDASGDETPEVVNEFTRNDSRIVYRCNEKNLGALNHLQSMAQVDTPFFTFCADDDVLLPQHLEHAMEGFAKYPQASIAYNQVVCMNEQRKIISISHLDSPAGLYNPSESMKFLLKDPGTLTGMVIRKSILENGVTADKEIGMLWDWDFCFRALAKYPLVVTQKPGCIFVAHSGSYVVASIDKYQWPGWLKMYQNIANHPELDLETRKEVKLSLNKRLRSLMVKQGKEAILSKNYLLFGLVTQVLKDYFGSHRLYFKLKIIALLCRVFPLYRELLISIRKARSKKKVVKGSIRYKEYQVLEKYLKV
jgi:glycosyltransferase involved in cell wall biosynthesis